MTNAYFYRTAAEIEEVVRRFEECSYTPEEFVHARHLTVAAWYFAMFDAKAARERMRSGLRKFIAYHGKSGYHETITEFWLRLVENTVRESKSGELGLVARVNDVIARGRDKDLIYEHYRRESLATPKAKVTCLEPDLRPLG
ncbi:MAG: hypothetical protein WB987_02205 [Candidatus Acidiferrales bacterium]